MVALMTGGCASVLSRIEISAGTLPDKPRWAVPVYAGMQFDALVLTRTFSSSADGTSVNALLFLWLFTGDLPLSLAADTLFLPFDVADWVTRDARRERQRADPEWLNRHPGYRPSTMAATRPAIE